MCNAVSVVFGPVEEGGSVVCGFFGRKLNKTQQNYATTKIYALGIV